MYLSQQISSNQSSQINNKNSLGYQRFVRYKLSRKDYNNRKTGHNQLDVKTNKQSIITGFCQKINQNHKNNKINFHQLLSLPLQAQIKRQNSIKENTTFFLKFQSSQEKYKQNQKFNKFNNRLISSSQQLTPNVSKNKVNLHNKKLFDFSNLNKKARQRVELLSQNSQRFHINANNDNLNYAQNLNKFQGNQYELKQQSKTVYFKPMGKLTRYFNKSSQSLQEDRKNMSFGNRTDLHKERSNGFRDKLVMLLQIRRHQQNEKRSRENKERHKASKSAFSQYEKENCHFTQRQWEKSSRLWEGDNNKEGNNSGIMTNKFISGRQGLQIENRYDRKSLGSRKKRQMKRQRQSKLCNNQSPQPWQLIDQVEDF